MFVQRNSFYITVHNVHLFCFYLLSPVVSPQPWLQALHAFFGIGAVLGPAIVGVVHFRLSNLCLCLICTIPTTIAIVSACWKPRNQKSITDKGLADAGTGSMGGYEKTLSDADDATNGDDTIGDGTIGDGTCPSTNSCAHRSTASSSTDPVGKNEEQRAGKSIVPEVSNRLRVALIMFYFVYVGLETGFGGE